MFKAFLFDLDGTVWDSENTIIKTILETVSEVRTHVKNEETLKKLKQHQSPFKVLRAFGISDYLFWKNYRKNYMNIPLFFSNTSEVFDRLLKSEKQIGFITSLRKEFALGLLEKFDLCKYPQILITPSECRTPKPSPRPIIMALDRLSIKNNQAIYIGNQDSDVIAARRAGCKSGLAKWGLKDTVVETPDYVFENIEEVSSLIEKG